MPSRHVTRLDLTLNPDPRRVLLRPFIPSLIVKPSVQPEGGGRILKIYHRVMAMSDDEAQAKLDHILSEFTDRHHHLTEVFSGRYDHVAPALPLEPNLSPTRKKLLGAYFTHEYSLESAALFNPSIVFDPDQSGVPEGCLRIILSVRATGEGHISSVGFRSGILCPEGQLTLEEATRHVVAPVPLPAAYYEKAKFLKKLAELGGDQARADQLLRNLPRNFQMQDLERLLTEREDAHCDPVTQAHIDRARHLAQANYTVRFSEQSEMSERVLFPYSPTESNGIEDARFVRFTNEDGSVTYYGTYTAYDGRVAFPQMLETQDFFTFRFSTLNGSAVANKGLALFPRKIQGRYAMLGRQDSENIHLMFSEDPYSWSSSEVLLEPKFPWEFVQLGNCGSPIETDAGWLVLTHGVGAMRKYAIGIALLDLEDPSQVLGRLEQPLLGPQEDEREGYVPNVVYSCGAVRHGDSLILPYAISDSACRFARVDLPGLLEELLSGSPIEG